MLKYHAFKKFNALSRSYSRLFRSGSTFVFPGLQLRADLVPPPVRYVTPG
ncbi:hypothetical protein JOE50_006383 [Bradyrhizobium japonicum]|nr:hypothetical protein [Bradyrhizobium japonicum]